MKFWTVDCFTGELFQGNPAGVCVLDAFFADTVMQKIAAEINLSETVFLVSKEQNHFDLRCFSPAAEVKVCSHATLAAAHILWTTSHPMAGESLYFESVSGIFKAQKQDGAISIDLPALPVDLISVPDWLVLGLGLPPVSVSKSGNDLIVELNTPQQVIDLDPNISKFAKMDFDGVIITADYDTDETYDFVSRYFTPRDITPENAASGLAHCKLATYWSERLEKKNLRAYQASKRGGAFSMVCDKERIHLIGQAVTVFRGEFLAI
jgi:PhzF family phenazine biosynthesis protein